MSCAGVQLPALLQLQAVCCGFKNPADWVGASLHRVLLLVLLLLMIPFAFN